MLAKEINFSISDEIILAYQWLTAYKKVCLLIMPQANGCQGAPLSRYPNNDSGYKLFFHMDLPLHAPLGVLNWSQYSVD